MLIVENGAVRWPSGPLATVDQADAYAQARGWSDWAALMPEQKGGAILDASAYVRASYRPPAKANTAVEEQISEAVIEAARLSLSTETAAPLSAQAGVASYQASEGQRQRAVRIAPYRRGR